MESEILQELIQIKEILSMILTFIVGLFAYGVFKLLVSWFNFIID